MEKKYYCNTSNLRESGKGEWRSKGYFSLMGFEVYNVIVKEVPIICDQ